MHKQLNQAHILHGRVLSYRKHACSKYFAFLLFKKPIFGQMLAFVTVLQNRIFSWSNINFKYLADFINN